MLDEVLSEGFNDLDFAPSIDDFTSDAPVDTYALLQETNFVLQEIKDIQLQNLAWDVFFISVVIGSLIIYFSLKPLLYFIRR